MFLTEDAVFNTLRAIASLAAGTEIIFQYNVPSTMLDERSRQTEAAAIAWAAASGEPLLSFFEPASLADKLRMLGFADHWNLGPEEANARYFANRTDDLRIDFWGDFMGARV